MKSYRDRYFEDYIAVPDSRRPGKVKYVYAGQYVEPFVEGKSLGRWKIYMAAAELLSIMLFVAVAFTDALFNSLSITAGIGTLAILPWMMEIWAVIRFAAAKARMKETDRESIENILGAGTLLHGLLMFLMVVVGSVAVVRVNVLESNLIVILGHLCMGILSFVIFRLYKRVYYHTYSNQGR